VIIDEKKDVTQLGLNVIENNNYPISDIVNQEKKTHLLQIFSRN